MPLMYVLSTITSPDSLQSVAGQGSKRDGDGSSPTHFEIGSGGASESVVGEARHDKVGHTDDCARIPS